MAYIYSMPIYSLHMHSKLKNYERLHVAVCIPHPSSGRHECTRLQLPHCAVGRVAPCALLPCSMLPIIYNY